MLKELHLQSCGGLRMPASSIGTTRSERYVPNFQLYGNQISDPADVPRLWLIGRPIASESWRLLNPTLRRANLLNGPVTFNGDGFCDNLLCNVGYAAAGGGDGRLSRPIPTSTRWMNTFSDHQVDARHDGQCIFHASS